MDNISRERWIQTRSFNSKQRREFIDTIRDRIHFHEVERPEAEQLTDHLILFLKEEDNADVRSSVLDALFQLTFIHSGLQCEWNLLADSIKQYPPNELEFVLAIIGFSENEQYAELLKSYLLDQKPFIRDSAEDALRCLYTNKKRNY